MPWKECHVMDERLRFAARLLEGEKMAPLCAEFGISRKTGYKIYERYKDCGVAAFSDRSRRPYRQANRLPPQLEAAIVRLKREYSGRGASKIREKLPLPPIESPLDLFLESRGPSALSTSCPPVWAAGTTCRLRRATRCSPLSFS